MTEPSHCSGKLFVGQVPAVCTENMLLPLFAPYGNILEIAIIRDNAGRSKSCAWVRYETQEMAQRAIDALHEKHTIPPQTNALQVRFALTEQHPEPPKVERRKRSRSPLGPEEDQENVPRPSPLGPEQAQEDVPRARRCPKPYPPTKAAEIWSWLDSSSAACVVPQPALEQQSFYLPAAFLASIRRASQLADPDGAPKQRQWTPVTSEAASHVSPHRTISVVQAAFETRQSATPTRTGISYHPDMLLHAPTSNKEPEKPDRAAAAFHQLQEVGLVQRCHKILFGEASTADLRRCHSERHIAMVDNIDFYSKLHIAFSNDLYACSNTARAARLAAGGAVEAAVRVARGELDNAFALIRPPGHHADSDTASGFCFFNNVAVAVRAAQQVEGVERVMILDWDVHHGNGTESIFYDDPSVLFVSLHQHFFGRGHVFHKEPVFVDSADHPLERGLVGQQRQDALTSTELLSLLNAPAQPEASAQPEGPAMKQEELTSDQLLSMLEDPPVATVKAEHVASSDAQNTTERPFEKVAQEPQGSTTVASGNGVTGVGEGKIENTEEDHQHPDVPQPSTEGPSAEKHKPQELEKGPDRPKRERVPRRVAATNQPIQMTTRR